MYRLYEFLFKRWKQEILQQGTESWIRTQGFSPYEKSYYQRDFIVYKLINKFDGSQKIKKVYLN